MGTVISIQRFSTGDGPGIRTTVFLKGCSLRCPWCSNPESQDRRPEPGYRVNLCIKCGRCIQNCAQHAISFGSEGVLIDRALCIHCGACARKCPSKALTMYGTEMTAEEVIRQVRKDQKLYLTTGGGMTLSGGEALVQIDFSEELLRLAKQNGIRTCIETTGNGDLARLLPLLDCVYMDIKAADPEEHKRLTGVTNEKILNSLRLAVQSKIPLTVRFPFIPEYNGSEAQIRAIAVLIAPIGVKKVEIMPYHEFGIGKYGALQWEYKVKSHKPTADELKKAVSIFSEQGIQCTVNER